MVTKIWDVLHLRKPEAKAWDTNIETLVVLGKKQWLTILYTCIHCHKAASLRWILGIIG